jgi:DNA polymerase
MARMIELKLLAETVSKCDRCPELVSTRTQTVFGVGPLDPKLLFLGEAPGQDEDLKGEPFVGAAGQQLNKIIAAIGLKRDDIFICNILRCRPPGNREPKPEEADCCREYLDKTIDLVQPSTIVCWGGVASKNLLKTSQGVTRLRGKKYEYRGIPVFVTLHPASLLYEGGAEKKRLVWEDMKMLLSHLGLPIPGKPSATNQ